jgi:hypothetical protein
MTPKETARIQQLLGLHWATIAAASTRLAFDFETPAQRIILQACAEMGISRLDWEKIVCLKNGWEFAPPPPHLLARWQAE